MTQTAVFAFMSDLNALMLQNPTLDVYFAINGSEIADDGDWTIGKIGTLKVRPWFDTGDGVKTDQDDIVQWLEGQVYEVGMDDAALREATEAAYNNRVKQVIVVPVLAE